MGGKVPQFEGEGTLKEYPDEYTKIFPMTRGGLAAAGQQCDDESKCDTSACPDGTNDCWKQAPARRSLTGPCRSSTSTCSTPAPTLRWLSGGSAGCRKRARTTPSPGSRTRRPSSGSWACSA